MTTETKTLPQEAIELLQGKNFAHLATLMPDGSPQVTPVWIDTDGSYVLFNTAAGRQKDRNLRRDPRVAIEVSDSEDPYRYVQIRGRVVDVTTEGAEEHITALHRKYHGSGDYPLKPGEQRVIFKIEPERVDVQ
jgi:PPOX class probable F420-dependent enzyme